MAENKFVDNTIKAILIAFLVLIPHFVPLPFYSYAIICMAAIILYLKRNKRNLRDLGLKRHGITIHTICIGILTAVLWVAFNKWVYHPLITSLFSVPDYTEYNFIRNHLATLLFTIAAAWIVGGFYEEVVFRGYIQSTIQSWLKSTRYSFWIAGLLTSTIFGLYHFQQGIFGMVASGLGGLFWTFLLWKYKKNLWYPILSHAIYDTIALTLIYFGITI